MLVMGCTIPRQLDYIARDGYPVKIMGGAYLIVIHSLDFEPLCRASFEDVEPDVAWMVAVDPFPAYA